MNNTNKVILITGSRKGIGRFLSEYYLDQGHYVVGCSKTESDLVNENYDHFVLDVADEAAVKKMLSVILKKYNRIDILLNNAGIASMNHTFLTPYSVVEKIFRTNVFGSFLFSKEVGKIMARAKYGRIVNFSTVAVPIRLEGEAIYAASKAAVESFTRILAKEFGQYGITCNAVGPSPIKTDLIKNVDEKKIDKLIGQQAIKTFPELSDIANIVDFFIAEKSNLITGQIIYLGGIS
ncbi:MAG: SDR family oxidoreductase [Bacteroidales bacterium]